MVIAPAATVRVVTEGTTTPSRSGETGLLLTAETAGGMIKGSKSKTRTTRETVRARPPQR